MKLKMAATPTTRTFKPASEVVTNKAQIGEELQRVIELLNDATLTTL